MPPQGGLAGAVPNCAPVRPMVVRACRFGLDFPMDLLDFLMELFDFPMDFLDFLCES